ncbi:MAG: hypothetical protein P9X26_10050 [Candidatus Stygibacter frigidus]|nr:hypothetical protein [Candidatus Stygibacter frigidus]
MELRNDNIFMGRLASAIGIVVIMILNESSSKDDHERRLHWTLSSLKNADSIA